MYNDVDRQMLGFEDAVRKYYSFLEDKYGYTCISSDMYCVMYKSNQVYINIYHERISYEIYFEIGLLPEHYINQLKVNSYDIITKSNLENKKVFFQASNINDVNSVVEKLAHITITYAAEALCASIEYFTSIADIRERKRQNSLQFREMEITEQKVKSALDKQDFNAVVKLYSRFENQLSPLQIKRLNYAKRMMLDKKKY